MDDHPDRHAFFKIRRPRAQPEVPLLIEERKKEAIYSEDVINDNEALQIPISEEQPVVMIEVPEMGEQSSSDFFSQLEKASF